MTPLALSVFRLAGRWSPYVRARKSFHLRFDRLLMELFGSREVLG
jgi:hypothetical protein